MTNSEKYKTAEERYDAFRSFRGFKGSDPFVKIVAEFSNWLDSKADDEQPLPCPFCGSAVSIHESDDGCSYVECLNGLCNYKSGKKLEEHTAISAHNHFAKPAMDIDEEKEE